MALSMALSMAPDKNIKSSNFREIPSSLNKLRKPVKEITVVLGCVLEGENVLLVKRKELEQPDLNDMWELPGGKQNKFERLDQAVIREIWEETGYRVNVCDEVPYTYRIQREYPDYLMNVNLLAYHCQLKNSERDQVTNDPKISELDWHSIFDIDYSKMLPESREFLWMICEKKGLKVGGANTKTAHMQFEYVDLPRHRKFYNISIDITSTEYSKYRLVRAWGKINRIRMGFREEQFTYFTDLKKRLIAVGNERIRHGYFVTYFTDNFPLKSWVKIQENRGHFQNKRENKQLEIWSD